MGLHPTQFAYWNLVHRLSQAYVISIHFFFLLPLLLLFHTRDKTQSLLTTRQVLLHWAVSLILFLLFKNLETVSHHVAQAALDSFYSPGGPIFLLPLLKQLGLKPAPPGLASIKALILSLSLSSRVVIKIYKKDNPTKDLKSKRRRSHCAKLRQNDF